jgi:hypothetical protein
MYLGCVLKRGLLTLWSSEILSVHALKAYRKAEVWFHVFFNSTLDGVRDQLQIRGSLHRGNNPLLHTVWKIWVAPDLVGPIWKTNLVPFRNRTLISRTLSPLRSRESYCDIPTTVYCAMCFLSKSKNLF